MSNPSLRQIAKELEISPAYLSYMLSGKRPWRKDLHQRYVGVVNSAGQSVNSRIYGNGPTDTFVGAGEEIRTLDFLLGKQTLYH